MFSANEKQFDWPAQIESLRRTIEQGRAPSIIGPEDAVLGDMECDGTLTIFGKVTGDVHGHTVVVEPGGEIEGRVVAQRALISGRVRGQVVATDVGIEGTAVVHGSIIHHNLAIEPGALVEGRRPWRPRAVFG